MVRNLLVPMLAAALALGACAGGPDGPSPSPDSEFDSEVRLGAMLPADAKLTGVAVSPAGKIYVLDERSGLYEVGPSAAKLVFGRAELARFGASPDLTFTDVAALSDQRFALTAENDGYLLDLEAGTFTSYFCYLPAVPTTPAPSNNVVVSASVRYRQMGIEVKQRTESVAFSPETLQLYAQPQTIRLDTGEVVGSELFVFPEGGGEPRLVLPVSDLAFLAGGMVAENGETLLLGEHDRLHRAWPSGARGLIRDFEAPIEIVGLAPAANGRLLLLDGAGRRLLEVGGFNGF